MLALGVDPRRLRYADLDLDRTPENYNKFPIVERLFVVEHPDGTQSVYGTKAPDENGHRFASGRDAMYWSHDK
jgi:hypothetical protein